MRRSFIFILAVTSLVALGYVGYSGWLSWQAYTALPDGTETTRACIDGVPIASAASVEVPVRELRWIWAQIPTRLPNIPTANLLSVKLPFLPSRDQVIIQFVADAPHPERRAFAKSIGGKLSTRIRGIDTYIMTFDKGKIPNPFPSSPIVANVEADYYAAPSATNDTHYQDQWAFGVLEVETLWNQLPSDLPQVVVAVVDSGVCAGHPDLVGRLVNGWDYIDDDNNPNDEFGHGCGVSGVIAANSNNEIGVAGVASSNVMIMPMRVLSKRGLGNYSDITEAIVQATDWGADIINLSLASPNPSQVLQAAIDYALSKGVTVIAASGNNGTEGAWYPAAYDPVLSVGSIDRTLERSSFSNYGAGVDLYAPGRDIYTIGLNDTYTTMTGTSFAAPLISGVRAVELAVQRYEAGERASTATETATEVPSVVAEATPIPVVETAVTDVTCSS